MQDTNESGSAPAPSATTLRPGLVVNVVGFNDAELEAAMSTNFTEAFIDLGRLYDLRRLDGVTIAADYHQALLDLDRGYKTNFKLKPTESYGMGVAMTPTVIRDEVLMSHIVLSGAVLVDLMRDQQPGEVIHLMAHECAHVELSAQFDDSFPNLLLRAKHDLLSYHRWEIILPCWDEYAACRLSAQMGVGRSDRYKSSFLAALEGTRAQANVAIKKCRLHHDLDVVIQEVCELYRGLMKCSAYHLGNLAGLGIAWRDDEETAVALEGSWFLPFFERLEEACSDLFRNRGAWPDKAEFNRLGDLGEAVIANGGLRFVEMDQGRFRVELPYTPETMPA